MLKHNSTTTLTHISECQRLLGDRYSSVRSMLMESMAVREDAMPVVVADTWVLSAQEALRREVGVATQVISDAELKAADAVMLKSIDGAGADNANVWLVIKEDAGDQDALIVTLVRDIVANPRKYASTDMSANATVSPDLEKTVQDKYPDVAGKLIGDDVVGTMRGLGIPDKNILSSTGIKVDTKKMAEDLYTRMGRNEVLEMLGYNTFVQLPGAVAYGR